MVEKNAKWYSDVAVEKIGEKLLTHLKIMFRGKLKRERERDKMREPKRASVFILSLHLVSMVNYTIFLVSHSINKKKTVD